MSTLININGEFFDRESAKISVFDRGFLYGDSIYEVTYSQDKTFIFLDEHLDRLWNSAALIGMEIQIDRKTLVKRILETAAQSNLGQAYARVIVTRGESELSLFPEEAKQNVVIYMKPNIKYSPTLYEKGLSLSLVDRPRNDRRSLDPNAKSGNYLNNVLAIQEAKARGADDAIMANTDGEITEGSTFNIWMVKDSKVYTPRAESGLLKGITREKTLGIAADSPYPCLEKALFKEDFFEADEVFITSSTKGIMPVYKLDHKLYAQNSVERPVTEALRKSYIEIINHHIAEGRHTY